MFKTPAMLESRRPSMANVGVSASMFALCVCSHVSRWDALTCTHGFLQKAAAVVGIAAAGGRV